MRNRISIENLLNSSDFFGSEDIVSYEFSIRHMPQEWNFMIMMGFYEAIRQIENFWIEDNIINNIEYNIGFKYDFSDKFIDFLENFTFTGNIQCVPEGEVIFPGDPILTITGKVSEIELIRNIISEILSEQIGTLTHCIRCLLASRGTNVVSNSTNPLVSQLAYIAGFTGTTDVSSSTEYNIPLFNIIDETSYVLNRKESDHRGFRILDFNDVSKTIKSIDKSCSIRLRNKNLDVNLMRIGKSDLNVRSLIVCCADDISKLLRIPVEPKELFPITILTNPRSYPVQVESYPVYNHTQEKYLMVPTSGKGTFPGVKKIYIDQRDGEWKYLISIYDLSGENLDPLIEQFVKDGELLQEEPSVKTKRIVCNGSLVSIPNKFLNLDRKIQRPFKIHRSLQDIFYQAYGELNE